MIRDRVAGEAVPACFPASLVLSPELAGIRSLHPEMVGDGMDTLTGWWIPNPTAAIYNRYKVYRVVLDRPDVAT
jgi:hypothetical protein